ncbi:MAG: sterol desaturase family protein [Bacteroidetes bacterium]|nr:sterol desaturase family protein [Bacteroidota bacterium]
MQWSDYWLMIKIIGSRYFITAGIAFLFFYVLLEKRILYKKIQRRLPGYKDYSREIGYSFITICIFALVPILIIKNPVIVPYTTYYTHIDKYGWLYFFLAFPLMFIMHDTYFYWAHRLMHQKNLFKIFHLVHHQSTNPSPWAAYAFHPLEAIVEAGIFPIFLFTIPIHPLHLLIFFLMMIIYNVYGHLGYELYPKGFNRHWLGKWINTSVNHNQHHQYFKGNYGLYFTFWDRLMGTIRKDYDECFLEIKSRAKI